MEDGKEAKELQEERMQNGGITLDSGRHAFGTKLTI